MKSRIPINELIQPLLILLFVYAAVSKLVDYDRSRSQMLNQVFPHAVSGILAWLVPLSELITAGLLTFKSTKLIGFYFSLVLMTVFTIYIALVILHVFGRVPCSCGGVLSKMKWTPHLFFNLFFLTLITIGIINIKRERRFFEKG